MKSHYAQPSSASRNGLQCLVAGAAPTLLMMTDVCLASVIFIAPLLMGGRHPMGLLVYVSLVCGAAVTWTLGQCVAEKPCWRGSGVELLLAAGFLLIALQIIALPTTVLAYVSPQMSQLLPLWNTTTPNGMGHWTQLSLSPESTRGALVVFTAHALLFLVVVQRVKRVDDIERLLRWMALAGIGMACLGLAQLLFGNGEFLWVYQHPSRDTFHRVKGTFSNENHFCQFVALSIGPLIWWLQKLDGHENPAATRSQFRPKKGFQFGHASKQPASKPLERKQVVSFLLLMGLGVVGVAGLLTMSRGGVLVMLLAGMIAVVILAVRAVIGRRSLVTLCCVGAVVGAALCIHGYKPLMVQLGTMGSFDELDRNSVRRKLWAADLQAAAQFPVFGVGGGAHLEAYPTYFEHYSPVKYTHAESGYIQILAEGGVTGAVLLVLALAACGRWGLHILRKGAPRRHVIVASAIVAGLTVSMIHSLWDFVWYIPACMSLAVILAACACRLSQLVRLENGAANEVQSTERVALVDRFQFLGGNQRFAWSSASLVTLALAAMMISSSIPPAKAALPWEAYLRLCKQDKLSEQTMGNDPATDALALKSRIKLLAETLAANPRDSGANVVMASHLLQYFNVAQMNSENAMWFAQLRQAAFAGGFDSPDAQRDWLARVCGKRFNYLLAAEAYAKRSVQLCPLQGEGYVYLGDLTVLSSLSAELEVDYISQALLVRPYRSAVLVAAGKHAASRGEVTQFLRYWKHAFHQDPSVRKQIITLLTPYVPAQLFLDEFAPEEEGLGELYRHYLAEKKAEEARIIAVPYGEKLMARAATASDLQAARAWSEAGRVYEFLDDQPRAIECYRNGLACSPGSYDRHKALAVKLLNLKQYDEAIKHFRWCRSRRPDDSSIQDSLANAVKQKHLHRGGEPLLHAEAKRADTGNSLK